MAPPETSSGSGKRPRHSSDARRAGQRSYRGGGVGRGGSGRHKHGQSHHPSDHPHSPLSPALVDCIKDILSSMSDPRATYADVGIDHFCNNGSAISAYVKQRYSDFIVNEIDDNGSVVHLSSFDLPPENQVVEEAPDTDQIEASWAELAQRVENIDMVREFIDSGSKGEMIIGDYSDKDERRTMHDLFKKIPGLIFSFTRIDGDKRLIVISNKPQSSGYKNKAWLAPDRPYLQMTLYKDNVETMKAVNALSQISYVNVGRFAYAGNKDRRGITTQLVTGFKIDADQLSRSLPRLRSDVRVGNFKYVKDGLKLGSLQGNRFGIVLRDVILPDQTTTDHVDQSLSSICTFGFINYFGLQRFGTGSVSTHLIGLAIMQKRFDQAVSYLLTPQPTQSPSLNAALTHLLCTSDISGAIDRLSPRDFIERTILQSLASNPNAYSNALDRLPRNMRLLYVHAFQSAIWNRLVSKRLRDLDRTRPVIGDLVMDRSSSDEKSVVIVSEENIDNYSIYDVVIPLPGYDSTLPSHIVGQYCVDILAGYGLTCQFNGGIHRNRINLTGNTVQDLRHSAGDYCLKGDYRPIIVKPKQFQWSFLRYSDKCVPLMLSDLDIMNGVPEHESVVDGDKLALRLYFSLPASSYATMLLREILKCDPREWHQDESVCDVQQDSVSDDISALTEMQ